MTNTTDALHPDEQERAVEALLATFWTDPLYVWLYPDPAVRTEALRTNLALTLDLGQERGIVRASGRGGAVAVWTEPGVALLEDPQPFVELLERWAPGRLADAFAGMAACAAHQPDGCWVLHLVGVDPALRGRGLGRQLVGETLHDIDRAGGTTYLESSNERNLSFYRRLGFEELAEVPVPGDGPVMRPMRRPAPA
jgi:ribosomal protein S18 acetylase RimI-like enzyme